MLYSMLPFSPHCLRHFFFGGGGISPVDKNNKNNNHNNNNNLENDEKKVRQYAKDELGLRLSQKGLSPVDSNTPLPDVFKTEEDIFRRLKLSYIPPHLRWS